MMATIIITTTTNNNVMMRVLPLQTAPIHACTGMQECGLEGERARRRAGAQVYINTCRHNYYSIT